MWLRDDGRRSFMLSVESSYSAWFIQSHTGASSSLCHCATRHTSSATNKCQQHLQRTLLGFDPLHLAFFLPTSSSPLWCKHMVHLTFVTKHEMNFRNVTKTLPYLCFFSSSCVMVNNQVSLQKKKNRSSCVSVHVHMKNGKSLLGINYYWEGYCSFVSANTCDVLCSKGENKDVFCDSIT